MSYSKGICWVDDTRIPFNDEVVGGGKKATSIFGGDAGYEYDGFTTNKSGGRFTPSLLVCDDMLNDGVITQYNKTREDKGNYLGGHRKEYVGTTDNDVVKQIKGQFFSDKGSNSRYYDLDKWFDKVIDNL